MPARRDENSQVALILQNILGTANIYPTGIALTNANAMHTAIVDGSGNQITSFGGGTQYANGAVNASPTGTLSLGYDGANLRALLTDTLGLLKGNITEIGGSALTLGQALAASSLPVVLTASQLTTLTPLSTVAVTGTFWQATQPVSLASLPALATGTNNIGNVGSENATGSAAPTNAFYQGYIAKTALPAAGTDGNLTGAMGDKYGRQVALVSTIRDLVGTQTTTISASTTETTIVTAATSIFNDLIMLIISNTSTATNTRIDFRDTTAGGILFSLQSNGGQPPIGFALPTPIPQTSVNTNWTAQCAVSTIDIRTYIVYAKNK